jgi:hypothetical protein
MIVQSGLKMQVACELGNQWRAVSTNTVPYLGLSETPITRIACYADLLGPSGKCVQNSTELACLEIAGYRIKYSTVLWHLDLQIRRDRNLDAGTYCKCGPG